MTEAALAGSVDDLLARAEATTRNLREVSDRRHQGLEALVISVQSLTEAKQVLTADNARLLELAGSETRRADTVQAKYDALLAQHQRLAGAMDLLVGTLNDESQSILADDRRIASALADSKAEFGAIEPEPFTAYIPGSQAQFERAFSAPDVVDQPLLAVADDEAAELRNVMAGFSTAFNGQQNIVEAALTGPAE